MFLHLLEVLHANEGLFYDFHAIAIFSVVVSQACPLQIEENPISGL